MSSWTVGADIQDQQCGNAWMGEHEITSLSLNGNINVFDKRVEGKASRVLYVSNYILASSSMIHLKTILMRTDY